MSARVTRVRKPTPDIAKIESHITSIGEIDEQLEELVEQRNKALASLMTLMQEGHVQRHEVGELEAELYQPVGRTTNIVDPSKFRTLCKNDKDFYECISVMITKAKMVVAPKMLATITKSIPGAIGPETIRVQKIRRGKKR